MASMTRQTHDPADKLLRLLAAARRVFAEDGFHKATIHKICDEAGVSVGSFYQQFEDKADLIQRVIDELGLPLVGRADPSDLVSRHRLETLLTDFFNDPVAPGCWRAWREASLDEPKLRAANVELRRRLEERLAKLIVEARTAAQIPATTDARSAAWAMLAMVRDVLTANENDPRSVPRLAELILLVTVGQSRE
jgi:AcrR family transcriptional regulator